MPFPALKSVFAHRDDIKTKDDKKSPLWECKKAVPKVEIEAKGCHKQGSILTSDLQTCIAWHLATASQMLSGRNAPIMRALAV